MHINHILFCLGSLGFLTVVSFCVVVGARAVWKRHETLGREARLVAEEFDYKWFTMKRLRAEGASASRRWQARFEMLASYWKFKKVDWLGRLDLTCEGMMLAALCFELISRHS